MFTFSSLERMNELVAKANKPVAKLGLPALTITSVTPREEPRETESGRKYTVTVFDAEITLPEQMVRVDGQEVVARLEQIEGLNMVTRISDYTGNLDAYQSAPICCQHCGYKRNRKGSWVIAKQSGEQIQVGDSCVNLYFGVDVERILNASYAVRGILGSDGGNGGHYEPVADFIELVVWMAASKGFRTKKAVMESGFGTSTASEASFLAYPAPTGRGTEQVRQEWNEKWAEFRTWRTENFTEYPSLYDAVKDYWIEKETASEFDHNCKVSILAGSLKFAGLVAYATKMWVDAVNKAAKAEREAKTPRPVSQHVGTVGTRSIFSLTLKNVFSFETMYGTTTCFIFTDEQGNCFVWKATANVSLTVGETYSVKGTIKEHSDYKGTKQTVLTRCSIG